MKRGLLPCLLAAGLLLCGTIPARAAERPACANRVCRNGGAWAEVCSATSGERIEGRAVFSARGDRGCVVRGSFSEGVELRSVTGLRQNGEPVNASYYTALERGDGADRRFEIHFAPGWASGGETELEIDYAVALNELAGTGERDNRCAVELSAPDGTPLASEEAFLRTFGFSFCRSVSIPDAVRPSNPVSGACFGLYLDPACTRRVTFAAGKNGVYTACTGEGCRHTRHTCLLKTPGSGTVRLCGLGAGTYYLQETRPPQGCAVTASALELVISEDGTIFAAGAIVPEGLLRLVERRAAERSQEAESDPLTFYEKGCRILSALLGALLMARRRLFR